ADIIGAVNAAGMRTGMKALKDTYNLYGYFSKILIAPAYCTQNSVSVELEAMAVQLGAIAYIDAPIGTTLAQALAGRGPAGTINFNTSSDRVRLCYPHVKVYDTATNAERLEPLSSRAAGLRARVDLDKGYWWSSSNQQLVGVTGVERPLSAMIDDPQSDVNMLNEQGITTVFSSYGSGLRLWGNRTAAWPTVTHMRNFENVRRTGDVINESLRYFSQQFVDAPIDQGLIDSLVESVNGFGRKLIGDGALLGFKAWFDPARNPKEELAAGHLLINYKYTVPPPLERLTYETEITSEYLLTLKGGN
ncbi:phage tail sheath family protein, partial [Pseudomonas aeruginosa]|nr:phage tail sheath family protein [Pseudomonas aeruginosa]